jgi:hypothetical protein
VLICRPFTAYSVHIFYKTHSFKSLSICSIKILFFYLLVLHDVLNFLPCFFFFTNMCFKKRGRPWMDWTPIKKAAHKKTKNLSDKRGEKPLSTVGDSSLTRYHHQQLHLFSASCPQQLPHFLEPFTSLSSWHNSARAAPVLSIGHNSQ